MRRIKHTQNLYWYTHNLGLQSVPTLVGFPLTNHQLWYSFFPKASIGFYTSILQASIGSPQVFFWKAFLGFTLVFFKPHRLYPSILWEKKNFLVFKPSVRPTTSFTQQLVMITHNLQKQQSPNFSSKFPYPKCVLFWDWYLYISRKKSINKLPLRRCLQTLYG